MKIQSREAKCCRTLSGKAFILKGKPVNAWLEGRENKEWSVDETENAQMKVLKKLPYFWGLQYIWKRKPLQKKSFLLQYLLHCFPSRIVNKILQTACTGTKATLSNRLFQGKTTSVALRRVPVNEAKECRVVKVTMKKPATLIAASASTALYKCMWKQRRPFRNDRPNLWPSQETRT